MRIAKSSAKVAIKTSTGLTQRMNIGKTIIQGAVLESHICTSTMDQLPKLAYKNPEDLYLYKGVPIPHLEMVDDILTVTNVKSP